MKLVSTKFTDFVPMEQFIHKPMGMYDGGLLSLADHHHTLPQAFDGIAPMPQGL